ncbi:telomere-protecting terminal protein Tpg [Streptomyces subrutilus]|uniref:telomere-protecting terminal protein Tpg n=1 Tax=Streptomyces subrutilus TaxID=36818 RepID=UPI003F53E9AA
MAAAVRAKARQEAATTSGIVVSTRARFGFEAAGGTTDDARIRDITQALPPEYAAQLFSAREQGAGEDQLRQIAAEGLARAWSPALELPGTRRFTPYGYAVGIVLAR